MPKQLKAPHEMDKFEILRELREIDEDQEERTETLHTSAATIRRTPTEILQRKTLLKHQLKLLGMKNADGTDAKALAEHWKRQAEEERKKQEAEAKREKERIAIAKKQAKKEMQSNTDDLAAIIAGLPKAKKEELLKKLK